MAEPAVSPTVEEESERLKKWREVRRRATSDPQLERLERAALDRDKRLELFEQDKARRIREAEEKRRAEAEALESRRMEKARAHLDALDDIETAKAKLVQARKKARLVLMLGFALIVLLPSAVTAIWTATFVPPDFETRSVFVLADATPVAERNPLFSDLPAGGKTPMAAAFQLRTRLQAQSPDVRFDMAIDSQQGLITLTTMSLTPASSLADNRLILSRAQAAAQDMSILVQPSLPDAPTPRVIGQTWMTFLVCLLIFSIGTIFIRSLFHHSRL